MCVVAADCGAGGGGELGGEFFGAGGVSTDAAGAVYVGDSERIQRFDDDGAFQRAWGRNVDAARPDVFGVCTVAADCRDELSGELGGELGVIAGVAPRRVAPSTRRTGMRGSRGIPPPLLLRRR